MFDDNKLYELTPFWEKLCEM